MSFRANGELVPAGGGDNIPLIRDKLTIGRRDPRRAHSCAPGVSPETADGSRVKGGGGGGPPPPLFAPARRDPPPPQPGLAGRAKLLLSPRLPGSAGASPSRIWPSPIASD